MLEMRNMLNTKLNKKGFTLAELLVVVAILAVLVAVSIPIFTGRLNAAKTSTDAANIRAAKSVAVNAYLVSPGAMNTATTYYYDAENGVMKDSGAIAAYGQTTDNKGDVVQVTITPSAVDGVNPDVGTKWVTAPTS